MKSLEVKMPKSYRLQWWFAWKEALGRIRITKLSNLQVLWDKLTLDFRHLGVSHKSGLAP